MFEFETALEARKVYDQLGVRMYSTECIRFKRDIWAIYDNISPMIGELSSLEVKARQTHNARKLPPQQQKIQEAMILLDKLILIQILSQ
jgi:hypothetical protein